MSHPPNAAAISASDGVPAPVASRTTQPPTPSVWGSSVGRHEGNTTATRSSSEDANHAPVPNAAKASASRSWASSRVRYEISPSQRNRSSSPLPGGAWGDAISANGSGRRRCTNSSRSWNTVRVERAALARHSLSRSTSATSDHGDLRSVPTSFLKNRPNPMPAEYHSGGQVARREDQAATRPVSWDTTRRIRLARSSIPTKSAPAALAFSAFSPWVNTATRTDLPVPFGS